MILPIIGSVLQAGGAIAGGIMQTNAAKRAAGQVSAQADKYGRTAQKSLRELQQNVGDIRQQVEAIQGPRWDLGQDISGAERISAYNRAELEKFLPGSAAQRAAAIQQINDAMSKVSEYMGGKVPVDVQQQIIRNVAERAGAGFAPTEAGGPSGFQSAQGLAARQLGLTSLNLSQFGIQAMPAVQGVAQNWSQIARQFTADPLDVARSRLGFESAAAEVGLQKTRQLTGLEELKYNAATGTAKDLYGMSQDVISANLASRGATINALQGITQAAGGGLQGISSAMQGAGGLNQAGFYGNQMQAANAFNVAPSQLSYQAPTGLGGFLGIGKQGGYYYNPGTPGFGLKSPY